MTLLVEHHCGRFVLTLPAEARVVGFSANIDGVELRELDLGDSSPEALELGWLQLTELERARDGFQDTRKLPGTREATCGLADTRHVLVLHQTGEVGLVLQAELRDEQGPQGTIDALRGRYVWPRPARRPPASFGLALGLLDLRPHLPEELSVTFGGPACGWRLGLETCAVAMPSPSDFGAVMEALESMPEVESPAVVLVRERIVDGLVGEEMFVTLGAGRVEEVEHQAIWRFPGRTLDIAAPEVELEFGISGISRDAALLAWEQVVSGLRLVEGLR